MPPAVRAAHGEGDDASPGSAALAQTVVDQTERGLPLHRGEFGPGIEQGRQTGMLRCAGRWDRPLGSTVDLGAAPRALGAWDPATRRSGLVEGLVAGLLLAYQGPFTCPAETACRLSVRTTRHVYPIAMSAAAARQGPPQDDYLRSS